MSTLLLVGVLPGSAARALQHAPPHRLISAKNLTGLAVEIDLSRPCDAEERTLLWAKHQNNVLTAYAKAHDVIPVALGSVFSSADALSQHLAQDAVRLEELLDQIAGSSEYLLQITTKQDDPGASIPLQPANTSLKGGDFLRRRKSLRDARRSVGDERLAFLRKVQALTLPLSRSQKMRDVSGKGVWADLSFLVPRVQADLIITTLQDLGRQSDGLGLALKLIGPLPAYSFLTTDGVDNEAAHG